MSLIPKIIHLISPEKVPPAKYMNFIDRMRSLHPLWEIIVWDDATALSVVDEYFPNWKQHYGSYKRPIQQADIFRVMIVYLKGGFYLDMDMFCLRKLDDLCNQEIVLGIEKILSPEDAHRLNHIYPIRIANYMFGSKPGHGLWLDFLNEAKSKADNTVAKEDDVLETTGPGLLTNIFHKTRHKYDDIVLLENKDRACPKSCGQASCHYGDYAAHYHVGSWRWVSVQ